MNPTNSLRTDSPQPPVLLAYDGSHGAAQAIDEAGRLFSGRRAVVVTTWRPLSSILPAPLCEPHEEVDDAGVRHAQRIAEDGARRARDAGLDATGRAAQAPHGDWQGIVEAALEVGAEAIVVGSRGATPARTERFGRTAEGILLASGCPVVVVPTDPPGPEPPGPGQASERLRAPAATASER